MTIAIRTELHRDLTSLAPPRSRSLAETLKIARGIASAIGVTRVADITGLDRTGIPIFQAIRPAAKSLTVAQGKGLNATAALISAVMEALEHYAAENVPRPEDGAPAFAATDLLSGNPLAICWNRIGLDTTGPHGRPALTTVGLGAGNTREEAVESGLSELIERHLEWIWRSGGARGRLETQISIDSLAGDPIGALVGRLHARRLEVRLWSLGQEHGLAVIAAALLAPDDGMDTLPPAFGCGCHPDRAIAAVRAITEAAQARAMLIAGSRDDLEPQHYGAGARRSSAFLLWSMGFADGRVRWQDVPHRSVSTAGEAMARLLVACAGLCAGPVACVDLASPDPRITVVKVIAPAFRNSATLDPVTLMAQPTRHVARGTEAVVFLGPTWPDAILPAGMTRRPPARAGDLAALLFERPPGVVGLIDGAFEQAPSVWHKEIMDLLAHGVAVYGGASLGALRAAELDRFGMVGVGRVYEAYRSGSLLRDDAVMVTHAPAELGFRPLTVSLVDAEAAIAALPMPPRDRRMLQRVARTISFRERTWTRCMEEVERRSGRRRGDLRQLLENPPTSIKRKDAELLVTAISAWQRSPVRPAAVEVPVTIQYRALLSRLGRERA